MFYPFHSQHHVETKVQRKISFSPLGKDPNMISLGLLKDEMILNEYI
jgi:hypothetical protein